MISRYPAQLYYSALPLLPSDTYLTRQYPTHRGCISVVTGRENSWTPLLFTLPKGDVAAFTPGGHMAAVTSHKKGIQIYNASNGLLNSSISTDDNFPHSAAFTEDGSEVVVVSSKFYNLSSNSHQIAKFNLVKQSGQILRTMILGTRLFDNPKLSQYGSYVAFPQRKNGDTRICIWKTDGSNDISIPLGCGGKVQLEDFALAGEPVHLLAVAMIDRITVLSIPSGAVQRTLYQECPSTVRISRDGSFLAFVLHRGYAELWSVTQGTLLAKFDAHLSSVVFSRTNRLYVVGLYGGGRIYDMSADPNNVTIKSFPLPSQIDHFRRTTILPTPDESQILIHMEDGIQMWSLMQFTDTQDAPRHDIIGIDLSRDASLLALATETGIEIWDARIGQCRQVIESRKDVGVNYRPVAFSPKGEFIVSSSEDGLIVVDVRAGELMPMTYSFSPPRGHTYDQSAEISFDSSKIAALYVPQVQLVHMRCICVWDLPSGTLLHNLECGNICAIQWSWRDQYLLLENGRGNPRCLNAETFQEEILEHPGDRFPDPSPLCHGWTGLRIRLSGGSKDPLFLALPSHLRVKHFASRGDRACIISEDGRLLLLDTLGLEAYMEICNLQPEVSHMEVC